MKQAKKLVWTDKSALTRGALDIVKKLRGANHQAFFAGGAVRDAILKRPIKEIDITTSATPDQVKQLFTKTIPTGEKHGTITVRSGGINYEVTTFRSEGEYLDKRRPSSVKFIESAEQDAKRRDFTVNALFYDPAAHQVIDFVGGLADLKKKILTMVGDPEERIKEDALRMLRAVRFAGTLRFEVSHPAIRAIRRHAKLIRKISAERVKQELDKIMLSKNPGLGLGLLDVVGLLEYILPEVKVMMGVTQPRNQHAEGDVYAHSMLAIEQVEPADDLSTRYAILFHDVGKPLTRQVHDEKITFYNHTEIGAEMAKKICRRLKFSKQETQKIEWLVKTHLVPNDFDKMRPATRLKWGLNAYFPDMLRVFRADAAASLRPSGKPEANPRGYREGLKILGELKSQPRLRKPILSGREVMRILKISEGPKVGSILKLLEEKKLSAAIKTKIDAKKFLAKNRKMLDKKLSTL